MGLTHIAVELRNLGSKDSKDTYTADFLVDTGATDSMVSGSELRRIGIQPVGTKVYQLASGQEQGYEYGLAQISFMGHITAGDVVFGPDNIDPILGVITLQSAGFVVDPKNERLRRLRALPLKMAVSAK